MEPEFASIQISAAAPVYPATPPDLQAGFETSDSSSTHDDPALETCKRELEAVLAALGPESS